MRLAFFSNRPACLLSWPLALALSAAAASPTVSAAAVKPGTPHAVTATHPGKPAKAAKPVKSAHRQILKSEASSLALASATAETINAAQLEIASRVLTGDAECEFNQRITVRPELDHPGYFTLSLKKQHFRMVPRETSTGAVRLEDPAAGIVWLQIPTKSMLMNARIGQRLVDACTHAEQRAALAAVTDAANALGILPTAAPVLAAASAAASNAAASGAPIGSTVSAAAAAAEAAAVTMAAASAASVAPATSVLAATLPTSTPGTTFSVPASAAPRLR